MFARAEYVPPEQQFDIGSLVADYVREVAAIRGGTIGVGGRASINFIPTTLEPSYGTRTPKGIAVYVRVRPTRMSSGMSGMNGMSMPPT